MQVISNRIKAAANCNERIHQFYFLSRYAERRTEPGICDFTFGNPHEMPLPELVEAIRRHAIPFNKDWFAYKTSEPEPQAFLAERLKRELSLPFEPQDIALTNGAFAAISVAFRLLLDVGDEAIFPTPAWFSYEPMLLTADATPRKVPLRAESFDLDLEAIDAAITRRTRLVIVNTPHNPTGRIYGNETLVALAQMLDRASERIGRRIFLLSDEPYRRIRFDDHHFVSPAQIYPWTVVTYSYAKVLLAPGQRLGYLAVSPRMPSGDRQAIRKHLSAAQVAVGWCFPNAVMQYALPDLEGLSIDMPSLTAKRDRMAGALEKAGYEVLWPEGTFYLFGKCPGNDPERFWNALADRDVFVIPGSTMDVPGHFRICLTASKEMVERSLPVFAEVAELMRKERIPSKIDAARRISADDLHKIIDELPPEKKEADGERTIYLANTVIVRFLGRDWFAAHIRHDAPKRSFQRIDFSSDRRRKLTLFRVQLAENLYNLQHIEGFAACIAQMKGGAEKIESTCAELDFGRLLYINDVEFRFVAAELKEGENYDFEIVYPGGLKVPADAKCKFETTKIDPKSVRNSLNTARHQLPKDRPGIIFVKVPQNWIDDIEMVKALETVAMDFFRNTDRVVSIKFYVSHLELTDQMVHHHHVFKEITNYSSRFQEGRDWDLFTKPGGTEGWNRMPPKWQRLWNFPNNQ